MSALDPTYKLALQSTIAQTIGAQPSDVTMLDYASSRRRLLTNFECRTLISVSLAQYPYFHHNESILLQYFESTLTVSVNSGQATQLFRNILNQMGNLYIGWPVIAAIQFNTPLYLPSFSPARVPDSRKFLPAQNTVSQALLFGLIGGVFAFMCVFMPFMFLIRTAVKRKYQVASARTMSAEIDQHLQKKLDSAKSEKSGPIGFLKKSSWRIAPHASTKSGDVTRLENADKDLAVTTLDFSEWHSALSFDHDSDGNESTSKSMLEDAEDENEVTYEPNQNDIIADEKLFLDKISGKPISNLDSELASLKTTKEAKKGEKNRAFTLFAFNAPQPTLPLAREENEFCSRMDLSNFYPEDSPKFVADASNSFSSANISDKATVAKSNGTKFTFDDGSNDTSKSNSLYSKQNGSNLKPALSDGIAVDSNALQPDAKNSFSLMTFPKNFYQLSPSPNPRKLAMHSRAATVGLADIYPPSEDTFKSVSEDTLRYTRENTIRMGDVYPEEEGSIDSIFLEIAASDHTNNLNNKHSAALRRAEGISSKSQESQLSFRAQSPQRSVKPKNLPTGLPSGAKKSRDSASTDEAKVEAVLEFKESSNSTVLVVEEAPVSKPDDFYSTPVAKLTRPRADTIENPADDLSSPQSVKFRAIKTKFETMIQKNLQAGRGHGTGKFNNTPT